MHSNIKKTPIRKGSGQIKAIQRKADANLSFSFKYLDCCEKFNYEAQDATYLCKVLERFREFSRYTARRLQSSYQIEYRCHPVDWSDPRVSEDGFGIPEESQLVDRPYQFQISKRNGRVHGFFILDVFYVVWLDPDHQLYPGQGG